MDMERSENALIVGAGNAGYLMLTEIYRGTSYPYNVVGFLDDLKEKGTIISGKKVWEPWTMSKLFVKSMM